MRRCLPWTSSPRTPGCAATPAAALVLPKAAILTHRSITANAANTVVSWGLTADDTALLNAPLFHTGGLNVFTTPLVYHYCVCARRSLGEEDSMR